MTALKIIFPRPTLPALIRETGEPALRRFLELFTVTIHNANTRTAYRRAVGSFIQWSQDHGINRLQDVQPIHVALYIEQLRGSASRGPSSKTWPRSAWCSIGW